jgi:hypothetical protein
MEINDPLKHPVIDLVHEVRIREAAGRFVPRHICQDTPGAGGAIARATLAASAEQVFVGHVRNAWRLSMPFPVQVLYVAINIRFCAVKLAV